MSDPAVAPKTIAASINDTALIPKPSSFTRALDEWAGSSEYNDILAGNYAKPLPVSAKVKMCPKCGLQYPMTELFCGNDGTPLPVH